MVIIGNIIKADDGKALRPKGTESPTTITRVALAQSESEKNWEDCDYGTPVEATEEDKNAALRRFGVEV